MDEKRYESYAVRAARRLVNNPSLEISRVTVVDRRSAWLVAPGDAPHTHAVIVPVAERDRAGGCVA